MFLIHLTKQGDFPNPKNLTPTWAQVEYSFKVLLGDIIYSRFPNQTNETDQYSIAEGLVETFNKKIWFTHVTAVHGQLKSLVNLSNNTNVSIVETDNQDVVKISNMDISFEHDVRFIIKAHAQTVLNQWVAIMKNIQIVAIPKVVRDDLTNVRNGYSFLSDPANSTLVGSLMQKIENHSAFTTTPLPNMVQSFLKDVEDFTENLIILVHMTTGIPPRATETTSILMYNNPLLGKRNLFILGQEMFVSLIYKKTMQKQFNFEPIVRFLPPVVSNIMFSYISMMRPMYDILNFYNNEAYKPSPLVNNFGDVDRFRKRFKNCFSQDLGVAIGIATYRHLVIHYMRNALKNWKLGKDLNTKGSLDSIMNDLAGHSEQTDLENYATTKITRSFSMSELDFQSYRKVCGLWHNLLGFDNTQKTELIIKQESSKIQVPKELILPSLQTNVLSVPRKESIQILKEQTTFNHFKSKEQYLGCEHSLYSTKDLMLSLPTGGGKSLAYQLTALAFPEKIIILVVPLVSIIRDIYSNCKALKIGCYNFSDIESVNSYANGGIYLVHYGEDERVIENLRSFIGFNSNLIHCIFFDEAHLLHDWSDMMQCSKFIGLRGTQNIKYVFLSASLHYQNIQHLHHMMVLDDYDTISLYDDHFNIEYVVSVSKSSEAVSQVVLNELQGFRGKALIFFPDVSTLQMYVGLLAFFKPLCYYGSMTNEDKYNNLQFFEQADSSIILCTTALGAGYNYGFIQKVIVVGALYSWDNLVQSFGRAGRNGMKCKGLLALTQKQEKDKSLSGLQLTTKCFRSILAEKHGHVISVSCRVLGNCEACWFCQTLENNGSDMAFKSNGSHSLKRKRLLEYADDDTLTHKNM